jgi:hypothetical protein
MVRNLPEATRASKAYLLTEVIVGNLGSGKQFASIEAGACRSDN